MNYGDGVYAGQFMGAMYAEAFFEADPFKLVAAGLKAIPPECMYAEMVRDMLQWRRENPDDWEKTWARVDEKYRKNKNYYLSALDVKLEGAFVLMGLLYGDGDLDETMVIACRCGSDSDCNPSSAGGVMFTTLGVSNLPERYHRKLDETRVFSHTTYNFPALLDVCEKLARQAVVREGGRIEKDADGQEVFVIPVRDPRPSPFEDLRNPGPIAGSHFSDAEMKQIQTPGLSWALPRFFAGWNVAAPVLRGSLFAWERNGRKNVILLRPARPGEAAVLTRSLELPNGKTARLRFDAALENPMDQWTVAVKAGGNELLRKRISAETAQDGWQAVAADLSALAGRSAAVEIAVQPQEAKANTSPAICLAGLTIEEGR